MWKKFLRLEDKIFSAPYKWFVKKGIVTVIETSHVAIHVWDECKPALIQLDVYTCGPLDIQKVFDALQQFEPEKVEYKFLDREKNLSSL